MHRWAWEGGGAGGAAATARRLVGKQPGMGSCSLAAWHSQAETHATTAPGVEWLAAQRGCRARLDGSHGAAAHRQGGQAGARRHEKGHGGRGPGESGWPLLNPDLPEPIQP